MSQTDEGPRKPARLNLRTSTEDAMTIREAASVAGQSVSAFAMESMMVAAERVLADRSQFTLSPAQWSRFLEIIDRPVDKRKPRLRKLLSQPSVLDQ